MSLLCINKWQFHRLFRLSFWFFIRYFTHSWISAELHNFYLRKLESFIDQTTSLVSPFHNTSLYFTLIFVYTAHNLHGSLFVVFPWICYALSLFRVFTYILKPLHSTWDTGVVVSTNVHGSVALNHMHMSQSIYLLQHLILKYEEQSSAFPVEL
jgi:hypothetical protein